MSSTQPSRFMEILSNPNPPNDDDLIYVQSVLDVWNDEKREALLKDYLQHGSSGYALMLIHHARWDALTVWKWWQQWIKQVEELSRSIPKSLYGKASDE